MTLLFAATANPISGMQLVYYAFIGGAIGLAIGIKMLSEPMQRKRAPLVGMICIFACTITGSLICGIMAYPVALLCRLILATFPDVEGHEYLHDDVSIRKLKERQKLPANYVPDPSREAYRMIGHLVYCNSCGKTTQKDQNGEVPETCPFCQCRLAERKEKPKPSKASRLAVPEDDVIPLQKADKPGYQ